LIAPSLLLCLIVMLKI